VPPSVTLGPRLLDQVCERAAARGHTPATVDAFVHWTRGYILFHGKRHPRELGRAEVSRYLEKVAPTEKEALRALESARQALEFLYSEVLCVDLGELGRIAHVGLHRRRKGE
jgi:hypothetical protein